MLKPWQKNWFLSIILWLWVSASYAVSLNAPLPAKDAFIFSISAQAQQVLLHWQIAPHYYLYKDRFHIATAPAAKFSVSYPQGELKYSAEQGRYEVFGNELTIPVQFTTLTAPTTMTISYQGCAEDGFCYPPITKKYRLSATYSLTPIHEAAPTAKSLLTQQKQVTALLQTQHLAMMFILFLGLGLLLAFTPCVLPMVPILTSIILGQDKRITTKKAFCLSLTYVLGMALTYAVAGVVVAKVGSSLQVWLQKPWIITLVSLMFVVLAFTLFDFYHLRLPHRLQRRLHHFHHKIQGGKYPSVFVMGVISTLIVSPCVTAPLVGVLVYIGQTGNLWLGASALFAIGMGMGIPLLLLGVSAGRWLPKHGPWMEAVKMTFGVLMLAMAVWLFSRILNQTLTIIFWGIFLIFIAAFMAWYVPKIYRRNFLLHVITTFVAIVGVFLILSSQFMPAVIHHWLYAQDIQQAPFVVIDDLTQLHQQVNLAKQQQRPILIDVYADWCESCLAMDKHVFAAASVQQALRQKQVKLLRIDLSANTANEQLLMQHFHIIAPPTIIFITARGKEQQAARIVGEISANEFLIRLNEAFEE